MTSLSELHKVSKRIDDGAWVTDLPNMPKEVAVKVRGPFNSEYNRRFAELASQHTPEQLENEDVQRSIDTQLMAETILLDWQGIDEPFSVGVAIQALDTIKVFRRAVNWAANNVARVGLDHVEDAAKN